jgi:tetratricopeptide (TPR) repeat protein
LQQLADARPTDAKVQAELARSYYHLGEVQGKSSTPEDAIRSYGHARTLLEKLIRAGPGNPEQRHSLGGCLHNLAQIHEKQGRREDALAAFQQAIEHQSIAFRLDPRGREYREWLSNHHFCAGRLLRDLDRLPEAVAAFLEFRALWPTQGGLLYDVAGELALCSARVGNSRPALSEAEQAERQRYADLALETVRQAVAHGFKDSQRLQTDQALDGLRSLPGFQKVLQELQAKGKKP